MYTRIAESVVYDQVDLELLAVTPARWCRTGVRGWRQGSRAREVPLPFSGPAGIVNAGRWGGVITSDEEGGDGWRYEVPVSTRVREEVKVRGVGRGVGIVDM